MVSSVSGADISKGIKGKRSIATIIGIIDGIGSVGACIGQIVIGYMLVGGVNNWDVVFSSMAVMTGLSCLPLIKFAF